MPVWQVLRCPSDFLYWPVWPFELSPYGYFVLPVWLRLNMPVWLDNVVFYNTSSTCLSHAILPACMAFNPFGFQLSPYDPSYLPIWHVLFAHIAHLFAHLAFFFLPIWHFFLAHLARSPPFDFTGKIENTTSPRNSLDFKNHCFSRKNISHKHVHLYIIFCL